jgi:hypothetical protein
MLGPTPDIAVIVRDPAPNRRILARAVRASKRVPRSLSGAREAIPAIAGKLKSTGYALTDWPRLPARNTARKGAYSFPPPLTEEENYGVGQAPAV